MEIGEIRRFLGHKGEVLSVAFLPDGLRALSGGADGTILLWDVETGSAIHHFVGHTSLVTTVAPSPDGRFALSGGWDESLRLWDINGGSEIRRIKAHRGGVSCVVFSPDGRLALSGSDHPLRLKPSTAMHAASLILRSVGPIRADTEDESLRLWDVGIGREIRKWKNMLYCVDSAAFSPDGRFAACSTTYRVHMWNVGTWKEIRGLSGQALKGLASEVRSLAFSPDGLFLLTGGNDKVLSLWDVGSGLKVRQLTGHGGRINSVAFSPDGRYVLSGSDDNTVVLWNAETGIELSRFLGHLEKVNSVAFSRDMKYALSGSDDGTLRLWPIPQPTATLPPHAPTPPAYEAPPPPPPPPPPVSHCPTCDQPLKYVPEYQRWYCCNCQKYM